MASRYDISLTYHEAVLTQRLALMIHGGGHVMLSRKDVRSKQTQLLLENGRLPVSIDYRLCPEVNINDGPMTDVCDALVSVLISQDANSIGNDVECKMMIGLSQRWVCKPNGRSQQGRMGHRTYPSARKCSQTPKRRHIRGPRPRMTSWTC